jgi:hypothetical protein
MAPQFPYLAAIVVTSTVGTVTTLVCASQVVTVTHVVAPPVGGRVAGAGRVAAPAVSPATLPGNAANTPTSTTPAFQPANVNLQVGANGAPALTQAATFGQAGLNQPGQAPFGETFVSQQTVMNQPGQPDFYQGNNPSIVQANEGSQPAQAYPNPNTPQTGVSSSANTAFGFATTQGNNIVGFYNGFGPGQPNFGFYNGFTAPHP